ncbi:hypothetical protein LAZ67_3005893 [Cordylochernes scorpioides]|uniref:Uncharacterized protein n=1 Tax=Cordylochernes scorpioides TaxID=51811 RepID=A0ABY6KB32_9ARAC|nr:hypothetical protein LAZ67_3005893 [Cordylochernes scorpioides]
MDLKSPKELEILGNVSENWKRIKQRFEIYLEASGLNEKKDKTKTAIFLNIAGENAIDIYNNFKFENEEDKYNLDIILKKIEDYCDPLENTTYERYVFFTRSQNVGEGIESYIMELKKKSKSYEFGELAESLIKDRLICGMLDDTLRERLLKERDLDLGRALEICKIHEAAKEQVKILVIVKVQIFVALTRKRGAGDLRELRPSSINDHDFIQLIEYFSRDRENM